MPGEMKCRSCGREAAEPRHSVFLPRAEGPPFASLLAALAGVRVAPGDGLPDQICNDCATILPDVLVFVERCRRADAELRRRPSKESKESKEPKEATPENDESERAPSEKSGYPCPDCDKRFKRKSDLSVHSRVHSGERPFACDRCPMRFAQSGTLIEHRRHHTGETPFSCGSCPKVFGSRSSFSRHRRVHTKERPYACEQCDKRFSHGSTLKHHRLVHSDDRPHACDVCGKTAKSKDALRQHLVVHSGKSYVCEHCGKRFSTKANLKGHIGKMHSPGAGRCVRCKRDTSDLNRHMLAHSEDAAHQCRVCGRTFRQKNALSFHVALHVNAAKYKCDVEGCDGAFPKKNMLDYHTRKMHSNEISHFCRFCSRGYFRISDLTRHLNSLHADQNRPSLKSETNPD